MEVKMKYPETPIQPVTDEYHGIPVEDPYRWLENPGDPQVRAWTDAQNHLVRETLDAIPQRAAFYDQLKKL
jgi:prolyl oligopeptidase